MNPSPEDLRYATADELAEVDQLLSGDGVERALAGIAEDKEVWHPLPGPQSLARVSQADILGFGGAAGGGKTDLAIGLALTEHYRVGFFRKKIKDLRGIARRLGEIVGERVSIGTEHLELPDGRHIWLDWGGFASPGEELKWQGIPHDLLVFDEAAQMQEAPVRFVLGWNRTTNPAQRVRALLTFNPPTTPEGRWILEYFGPWLDRKHPHPAQPGELRWFATVAGIDHELEDGRPFVLIEGQIEYDFDPGDFEVEEIIRPHTRTFIPSRIKDNPYLVGTGYVARLQSFPEPLRSMMLYGDFDAGLEDDPMQVIPTSWVEKAMERWEAPARKPPMDSIGVDVALGGRDQTILARRHGFWFDKPIVYEGRDCTDGPTVAGFVLAALRDRAVIHIDLFGVGSQPYGHLMGVGQQVVGVNVGEPAGGLAEDGRLPFKNLRSELWWRMREALDPTANNGIALPPDRKLLADLCAPKWGLRGQRIEVQSREDLVKQLGRSPDYGSAYVLALIDTPKLELAQRLARALPKEYNPFDHL